MRFWGSFTRLLSGLMTIVFTLAIVTANTLPANATSSEQALTVAFLYNFLKFAEWPQQATTSNELTLCVTDSSSFDSDLEAISGRPAQNKTVRIKRIELGDKASDCQLLFLPREEKPVRIREWLKRTKNTPILMVSSVDGFLEMGGMIVLIDDGNRLQFEVNLEQVKANGLKLSAQLLKIARAVQGK
ncbi:putative transmembrane protein [Crenothrix polyspora]|uniref:Putative transmembrane protein n=2 Tax=Crenothrix polyspora TaxID=360316 RepID=A0A1R4H9I5_9GAMM|nr:putative transmembrane protein [Crenothrix polyspora]